MTIDADLLARARAWIDQDPDPSTRQELTALLERGDGAEVSERMAGVLEFGTAGLRGAVEAGSNRMNRAVVIRATAGLAAFLRDNGRSGPVVVGFDGRTSSPAFADDVVGVLVAAGRDVRFFTEPVPTPLVAFEARVAGAAAAVVVTASHNPPADNGYKVYDSNAAQIVPPVDRQISDAIERAPGAADVPRVDGIVSGTATSESAVALSYDEVVDRYRAGVEQVRPHRSDPSGYRIAYTPLHGVGWETVRRLLEGAGYDRVAVVDTQRDPDGAFPTVAFPNPEEPGAMDAVLALARQTDAHLVLANDPDADRLAVAVPDGAAWRTLTGNDVGVLLADWILQHWGDDHPPDSDATPIVINSIVSSPMLASVARLHGAHFEQTLTGFKWIANAALELESRGLGRFAFGYEEALGYTVGRAVRDKDGMSAALVFADMASSLAADGLTVLDRMADLRRRAGLWVSTQKSIVRPGTEGVGEIASAMDRLGERAPQTLGARAVERAVDYREGAEDRPPWLAATSLVALHLDGGGRVLVRPSGTEPKLKIYADLPGDDAGEGEETLRQEADRLAEETAAFLGL